MSFHRVCCCGDLGPPCDLAIENCIANGAVLFEAMGSGVCTTGDVGQPVSFQVSAVLEPFGDENAVFYSAPQAGITGSITTGTSDDGSNAQHCVASGQQATFDVIFPGTQVLADCAECLAADCGQPFVDDLCSDLNPPEGAFPVIPVGRFVRIIMILVVPGVGFGGPGNRCVRFSFSSNVPSTTGCYLYSGIRLCGDASTEVGGGGGVCTAPFEESQIDWTEIVATVS